MTDADNQSPGTVQFTCHSCAKKTKVLTIDEYMEFLKTCTLLPTFQKDEHTQIQVDFYEESFCDVCRRIAKRQPELVASPSELPTDLFLELQIHPLVQDPAGVRCGCGTISYWHGDPGMYVENLKTGKIELNPHNPDWEHINQKKMLHLYHVVKGFYLRKAYNE